MKPYQKATRKGCGLCRDREASGRPEEQRELRRAVAAASTEPHYLERPDDGIDLDMYSLLDEVDTLVAEGES